MLAAATTTAGGSPVEATTAASPAAASASPTSSRFLKVWSAAWMGHGNYTQAQAVALARRASVIAAMPKMFRPYVAAMKAANPALKLVVYQNATFGGSGYPNDLYARNSRGGLVSPYEWPTTHLMKIGDPRWSADVARRCGELVRSTGYDGCFLDVLGSGPLTAPTYLQSQPVTGGVRWTPNQWISWSSGIARTVGSANPRVTLTGNGLGNGRRYFDPTQDPRPLVPLVESIMPELFLRAPTSSVRTYLDEADWKRDVDMVVDVQRRGGQALTMTKIWITATQAQQQSWHRYALASFLLASNGASKFCFLNDRSAAAPLLPQGYNAVDIGTPTGAYAKAAGVYQRTFTRGLAVVNPTDAPVTVRLTRPHTRLDGTVVSGSLVLGPNSGDVLRAS